jgi:hypothetical protein
VTFFQISENKQQIFQVKHFDRRYSFNTFKELLEKEGYSAGPDPEKLKTK